MSVNVFGAWGWIFLMAITLATLAIALPIAVIKALCLLERAGALLVGRLRARASRGNRSAQGRSPSAQPYPDLPVSSSTRASFRGRPPALTGDAPRKEYR